MYLDIVVISGIATIGLIIAFGIGFAWFIKKDIDQHPESLPNEDFSSTAPVFIPKSKKNCIMTQAEVPSEEVGS